MPCYNPLHGYRAAHVNPSGKRSIVFNTKDGFRDLPVTIPCGQCIGCRLERSRQWAMRCVHEGQLHVHKCFITLTYDDDHVPKNGSLDKVHFQKFIRSLRKRTGVKIRYFQCGEYGDVDNRPHYHAVIYGFDFPDKRFHTRNPQGNTIYKSDLLESTWGKGFCTIGELTFETAAYTARYILKKVSGDPAEKHYGGRLPEYVTMSLKPAIGNDWYERFSDDVFPSDFVVLRGRKLTPPKFYAGKLEKEDEEAFKKVKRRRVARAKKHADNSTPERLRVRQEVQESKLKTFLRKTL